MKLNYQPDHCTFEIPFDKKLFRKDWLTQLISPLPLFRLVVVYAKPTIHPSPLNSSTLPIPAFLWFSSIFDLILIKSSSHSFKVRNVGKIFQKQNFRKHFTKVCETFKENEIREGKSLISLHRHTNWLCDNLVMW